MFKKTLLLCALVSAAVSAKAVIVTNLETATQLNLSFELKDHWQLFGDSAATETYNLTVFPGTSLTFYFKDGLFGFGGDKERFATDPVSGLYSFSKDGGDLDFSGSYTVGSTIVDWTIDSRVSTVILGNDTWSGTVTASARSVPDGGITVALLGLGLLGIAALRRKLG
jgi:hypothetical protein